uniref:AlNc14C925G12637 protein n=1 Tax=Albugo laibachii Nc14 TaxID=890382 RepID=F0X2A0_9STRA|nr:AlNc14C925G12637 [Albugo laibachii Nc14]|eukprot:CCA27980.1 AlNc14C925G12637 [Albugo laibachii Nc14]
MYYSAVDRALTLDGIDCILVVAGLDADDLLVWKAFTENRATMWLGYASFVYWGFESQTKYALYKEVEKRKEKLASYASEGMKMLVTGWAAAAPASVLLDSPFEYSQLIAAQMDAYDNAIQGSVMVSWKVSANKHRILAFDTESMIDFGALHRKKATPVHQ